MIIFAGLIVLIGLVFFSVNKWQKAEKKLKKAKNKKEKFNIFIAYYLNHIRLIDNF